MIKITKNLAYFSLKIIIFVDIMGFIRALFFFKHCQLKVGEVTRRIKTLLECLYYLVHEIGYQNQLLFFLVCRVIHFQSRQQVVLLVTFPLNTSNNSHLKALPYKGKHQEKSIKTLKNYG